MTREVTNAQVERMWSLYQGLRCAYGTYDLSNSFYEGKKLKGAPLQFSKQLLVKYLINPSGLKR